MTSMVEIQNEIERVTALAVKYISENKDSLVVFVGQIDYNGYDAGKLLSILKEKAKGRDFGRDLCYLLVMRYTRGTGFVRDVRKKIKVAAGADTAYEIVTHYGVVQSVGDNADAITLGRLAALFPYVSMNIVKSVSTGAKLALDTSDLGTSGLDILLWDFVPQFINLDSVDAPYCNKKNTSNILFSLHLLQGALTTRKTMPDQKKKKDNLTTDFDLLKYTAELLVITCSAKNLTDNKKSTYRKKLVEPFRENEDYKADFWTALGKLSTGCLKKMKKDAQNYLKDRTTVLKLMVDNCSGTDDEAAKAIKDYLTVDD
uniref:Nucleoprotein n=1 Tax=Wheat yellow head virus TaxID=299385 RepID=NCAP_WYHV|nr:RecName: Full=Nucleoprotein; AltName: Full=Coat protein; Short=CP; AltName: Full=Nucleocapsid protein; Short=Protein N; AltName: Full=Protein pc3 [Wheat yellow head virus]